MAKKETTEMLNEAVSEAVSKGDKMTREAVDKSMKLAGDLQGMAQANMEAWVASATAAGKGLQALGTQISEMTRTNMEASLSAVKTLTGVKSVQEAMEIQADLSKKAMEAQMAEAKKLAETSGAIVQEVIQPLSERAKAAFDKVS